MADGNIRIKELEEITALTDNDYVATDNSASGGETKKFKLKRLSDSITELAEDMEEAIDGVIEETDSKFEEALALGTSSGSIASFTDGSTLPMKKLEVDIEPVQDLHGYDNPWVGGSGKNKCPKNSGSITVGDFVTFDTPLPSGTYSFSLKATRTPSSNSFATLVPYDIDGNAYSNIVEISANCLDGSVIKAEARELNNGISKIYVYSIAGNWSDSRNYTLSISELQIESGSTATTFEPYSNECPIIGFSGVEVSVSGFNVWDEEWEHKKGYSSGSMLSSDTNIASKNYISCKPSTAYYFKIPSTLQIYLYQYDSNKDFIKANAVNSSESLTTESNTAFLKFASKNDGYSGDYNNDISINYPSTATEYEPHNGLTYTIDLDGTRYGGTLDVVNGVLTVDRAYVDLGTLNWAYESTIFRLNESIGAKLTADTSAVANMLCSIYKTVSQNAMGSTSTDKCIAGLNWSNGVRVKDSDYTTVADFKTAMDGVQLVYELATPQTIQLTPTEVKSLLATNNVFADTGDIIDATYVRNANITINDLIRRIEALES